MAAKKKKKKIGSRKWSHDENLNNHFPKGIFQKNWLKVSEHEYNYILKKKYSV